MKKCLVIGINYVQKEFERALVYNITANGYFLRVQRILFKAKRFICEHCVRYNSLSDDLGDITLRNTSKSSEKFTH